MESRLQAVRRTQTMTLEYFNALEKADVSPAKAGTDEASVTPLSQAA
jgi:hypothetical protein